jgi:uncharacterized protein (TIGR02099 family)
MKHVLLRIAGHTYRLSRIVAIAVAVLLILAYAAGRLWLPTLLEDKASVEATLARISGQKIKIDRIEPWWDGVHPGVHAIGVQVYAPGFHRPSVVLDEVRVSVSLLPLIERKLTIYNLVVVHPQVVVERLADNRLRITGFSPVAVQPATAGKDAEKAGDSAFMGWLFRQRRMAIEKGSLKWVDSREPVHKTQHLENVDLSLENHGNRHHLKFVADFPKDLCQRCSLDIDIEGNPLTGSEWGGRVNVNAQGLNLDALPLVAREGISSRFGGRFDLNVRTQWSGGVPRVAQGRVDATNLRFPSLRDPKAEIHLRRLRAGVAWRGRPDAWQLDVKNAMVAIGDSPWAAGYIRVDHSPSLSSIQIKRVDLTKLSGYVTQLGLAPEVSDLVKTIRPGGTIDDLSVQIDQRADARSRFMASGQLHDIRFDPYKKLPGIDGLSGYLLVTDKTGELRLNSEIMTFRLPWMFREPIPVRRAIGKIRWARKNDRWDINAKDIRAAGDAIAQGDFQLQLPFDHEQSPYLKMRFSFFGGDASHASRYYPVNRLHKKLLHWLDQAVVGGEVVSGHLDYDGPTRAYPFKHGEGKFEVQARVKHAQLVFLEGWPPIEDADTTLTFSGPEMLITADDGRIGDLQVSDVVARKAVISDKTQSVVVTGRVFGPVATAMDVLRHAPKTKNGFDISRMITPGLEGSGNGSLSLHIDIPHVASQTRISGEYRFLGGGLKLPVTGMRLTDMHGAVRFSHKGIDDGEVHAKLLNQPAVISASTRETRAGKETVFVGRGKLNSDDLAAIYGRGLGRLIAGTANWSGELRLRNGLPYLKVQSRLEDMRTLLPAPFASLGTRKPETVLETVRSDHANNVLRMRLGHQIAGIFDFQQHGQSWQFRAGRIVLGSASAALPSQKGLEIVLRSARLDAEPWISYLRQGNGEEPSFLTRVSVDAEEVHGYGREFGFLRLGLDRQPGGWSGAFTGETAEGTATLYEAEKRLHVVLDLDRFQFPSAAPGEHEGLGKLDPREFPVVVVRSKKFSYGEAEFGKLDFSAQHTDLGWRIERLNLDRDELRVRADGSWYKVIGHDSLDMNVELNSSNMGQTMAGFGLKNFIRGGKLKMKLKAHWREDPQRPGLKNLDGTASVTAKDGTILNMKHGAARLAGIFNLRSLGEMMTLNFKPAVGSAFSFSEVKGRVAVRSGVAYTDGIVVHGSVADIAARGTANLVNKDINVVADISPNLRDPVTFAAGWIWGPQTAAIVLALQQIFHKDIEKGTRITYKITGKLDSPMVTKVTGTKPTTDSGN